MGAEALRRQVDVGDFSRSGFKRLRANASSALVQLQEEAVRTELYPPLVYDENGEIVEPSVVDRAATNAVWARKAMYATADLLIYTGERIKLTETSFRRSTVNCEHVKDGHLALKLGVRVIHPRTESEELQEIWDENASGARRNIQALANLTPLAVIQKAYSAVDRAEPI